MEEQEEHAPETEQSEERKKYDAWPTAVGYETVPPDWKPTLAKPLPALRCFYVRPDGTRCKKFGVRGTGGANTNGKAMCFIHGGSLPAVKAMAEAQVSSARMKLIDNADAAVDSLIELSQPGTIPNVRLGAIKEILDRAGIKGGPDLAVEVTHSVSYKDEIAKRLADMRERKAQAEIEQADIIDAEEVTDEEK